MVRGSKHVTGHRRKTSPAVSWGGASWSIVLRCVVLRRTIAHCAASYDCSSVNRYRVRGALKGQLKMVQAACPTSTMQTMQTEFPRHMLRRGFRASQQNTHLGTRTHNSCRHGPTQRFAASSLHVPSSRSCALAHLRVVDVHAVAGVVAQDTVPQYRAGPALHHDPVRAVGGDAAALQPGLCVALHHDAGAEVAVDVAGVHVHGQGLAGQHHPHFVPGDGASCRIVAAWRGPGMSRREGGGLVGVWSRSAPQPFFFNLTLVQILLTTNFKPPNPPPKKWYPVSGGCRPQNQKIHWGIVLSGKIMILQGVGHPISCLGVCYANDPQKGGAYGVRACT